MIELKKYNLIVAGGGLSGIAASVSAARLGLRVLLIEKNGCLGGALSNSLVYPFFKYMIKDSNTGESKFLNSGIFKEIVERKEKYNDTCWEVYKFVFDDIVNEAGVDVLFHAKLFNVSTGKKEDLSVVENIDVITKSGVITFEADFFVDCTGDGDLFALSGCDYQLGREEDSLCQPMTTCFRICGVETEKFWNEKPKLQEIYKDLQSKGKIVNPRENLLEFTMDKEKGIVHLNTTRVVKYNPTDAFELSKAEIEARKQVREMFDFLRTYSEGCKNASLIAIAPEIGIRESRKLKGVHILKVEELYDKVYFDDTIALGNYPVDIHSPDGSGTVMHSFKDNEFYCIPYRSLLPKDYSNLLVAGRCISATHKAQAAIRVMNICTCLGQAAGTAIALAYKTTGNTHTISINELRNILLENGACL